jgi:hypothetical protein
VGGSERHYRGGRGWKGVQEEFIFDFEGSEAVLVRPSCKVKAFNRH